MKGMKALFYLAMICAILGASASFATADSCCGVPGVSTSLDLSYVSKYVWRGLVPNPDPAFQPSLTFTHTSGVALNIWGSMDTTDVGEGIGYGDASGNLTEIDYTLSYSKSISNLALNGGLISYTFPHTGADSTAEVFGGVCFGGTLSPTLSVNYDFDQADGFYASFSGSYACNLTPNRKTPTTMNLTGKMSYASANYNSFYFGTDKGAFTDFVLSASYPFQLNKMFKLTPSVSYSSVVDGDLRDAVSDPDVFYGGVTLSCAF